MESRKNIFLSILLFFFLIIISSIDISFNDNNLNDEIGDKNIKSNPIYDDITPLSSVSDPFNKSNYFLIIDEPFSNLNDWTTYGNGTSSIRGGGPNAHLEMTGVDGGLNQDNSYVEYNVAIPQFIHGNISFSYSVSGTGVQLYFQVYDSIGGYNWHDVWSASSGSDTAIFSIDGRDTDDPLFNIRFRFNSWISSDTATVDNFKLGNYEFQISELGGDPISASINQNLNVFINPNFQNWIKNNVTLRYSTNRANIGSGTLLNASETSNNFTFTIPENSYVSGENLYYQIFISSSTDGLRKSKIFSFSCIDVDLPSITNLGGNESSAVYYKDVLITCHIEDNPGGSGLYNAVMYIDTNPNPDSNDIIIKSNYSSIPIGGGNFRFIISKKYLNAKQTIHYRINATDMVGISSITSDMSFTIGDDIAPRAEFYRAYAPSYGIENNKSLIVSYNITEPSKGIGLPLFLPAILCVKINNAPNNNSDHDFLINPDNLLTSDGGIFNFTINELNYNYGDTIYFYLNATDNNNNLNSTFPHVHSIYVNDTIAPHIIHGLNNGNDAIYNQSKTLSFTISEPNGASGINNDSLILSFEVGNWDGIGRYFIEKDVPLYGGVVNFIINQNNYSYGQVVFYQLNVSDNVGNNYSSNILSFNVGDPFAPTIYFVSYSNNTPSYLDDFDITLKVWEDSMGSLLSNAELYVKNNTASWNEAIKIYDTNASLLAGTGGFVYFKINSSLTYSRYDLDWVFRVIDNANNKNNLTGSITIQDNINPAIIYNSNNATIASDIFEYDQYVQIFYDFFEPKQGSGFNTDGSGLILYYKIGVSTGPADFDGTINIFETIIGEFGGTYSFIINKNILNYSETIWFWVNGADIQGNSNNTWSDKKSIYVDDVTPPIITLNSISNSIQVSYHEDKTIKYTPTEYFDSSRLKNATLYWRINATPTLIAYDGNLFRNFTSIIGGTEMDWVLPHITLGFKYACEIFFIIQIYDNAGNNDISVANSFIINDTIAPNYNESISNQDEWTWRASKILKFTVYDPDYDNSSGISSIILYYNPGSAPTDKVYNGTVLPNEVIVRQSRLYSFNLSLYKELYLYNPNHQIYYFIQIIDIAGRIRNSTVQHFKIYDGVYKRNAIIGPEEKEWLDSTRIYFYLETYFVTNLWVILNGTLLYQNNSITVFDNTIEVSGEGFYLVQFKFLNNQSILEFRFSVDLYAPSKITNINTELYGFDVIEITWDEPEGTDSKTWYKIYRSTEEDFEIGDDTLIAEIEAGEPLFYEDSDIKEGTTYYYKIVAIDRVGHISESSDAAKIQVPKNPLFLIILLIVIGIAVGSTVFLIVKKVKTSKREKLFSQVDLKDLKIGEEELIEVPKKAEWKEIKVKTEVKPIVESGFEFTKTIPKTLVQIETYWQKEIRNLINKAIEFELRNEYGKALKIYAILIRVSKRINNNLLTLSFRSKKEEIFNLLST
ncbi:MAG: hypothetical protein ACTSQJ_00735 [Promethearchaeota archaeon]